MRRRLAVVVLLTIAALVGANRSVLAQFGRFSPAERFLLLGLGSRRVSRGDFMRQMYALDAMDRSYVMRQQQFVRQQYAARRARAQQAQLQALMAGGRRPSFQPNPTSLPQETPQEREQVSDFLIVWEVLGCTFDAEVRDEVKAVDPRFDTGLRVAAIQVGGPADQAGWQAGDILIGLHKYRTRTYENVAFVADLPDLVALSPMRAILIRDGKVVEMPLDFRPPEPEPKPSPDGPEAQTTGEPSSEQSAAPTLPASPIATEAEPGGVKPTSAEAPTKVVTVEFGPAEKLWKELGIRCESVDVTALGDKFDRGLKITRIRESSPAANLGWKTDDVLVGLAGYQTRILSDVDFVLAETRKAGTAKFILLSGDTLSRGAIEYDTQPDSAGPGSEPDGPTESGSGPEPGDDLRSP